MPPIDPRDFADMSREALEAREDEWARRMLKVYEPLRADLTDRIALLKRKLPLAPLELRGSYNWQLERLSSVLKEVEHEEVKYARTAATTTAGAQAANLQAGIQDVTLYTKSLAIPWHALPVRALEHLVGFMENGSALEQHFRLLGAQRYDALRQTLFNGMALGKSPNAIAQELTSVVDDFTRKRATLVVRQESVRSYREGNIQSYHYNSSLVDGWIWTCLLSPQSCVACIALDGTFHPLSESFGSHVSCRCVPIPHLVIDESPLLRETGTEWFVKQPAHVQEQILGPVKYRLYREGKLTLTDIVDRHHSPWGPTASIKSVKQLVAEGKVTPNDIHHPPHHQAVSYPVIQNVGNPPVGTPVSAALQLPSSRSKNYGAIKHAVDLIDTVHGDGSLPTTVIHSKAITNPTTMGYFAHGASPYEIAIQRTGTHPHPVMTTIHEIGHLLDLRGLPGQGFTSKSQQALIAEWWEAVYNSRRYQDLLADGSTFSTYLLRREELFARSYAQYIVIRSGDAAALQELQRMRSLSWLKVWDDDDFTSIAEAMDNFIRNLGWQ